MALHTFVVLAYKESKYLETCIKSVLNQKYRSDVVIATSTPNDYINSLANKYNLEVIEVKSMVLAMTLILREHVLKQI